MSATNTHDILAELLEHVTCKPHWKFRLESDTEFSKKLVIRILCEDSRETEHGAMLLDHYFPVPEATYNLKSWRRWVFECCRKVEDHELGEWFLVDGERPFAPLHGPGCDPYVVRELSTDEEARTDQRGNLTGP